MDEIRTMDVKNGLFHADNVAARLGNDFYVFDLRRFHPTGWPFKIEAYGFFVGRQGESRGTIDLRPYRLRSGGLFMNMPGQLFELSDMSDDFRAVGVMMSREFVRSLGLPYDFQLDRGIRDNPLVETTEQMADALLTYCDMVRGLLSTDSRYKRETLRHLTCAFFYGLGSYLYQLSERRSPTNEERLMQRFLDEVKANFKRERQVQFYADRLCLTPKYLSTLIKKISGRGAGEWINGFVIEEARAMLKGSTLTVQQISDSLGFPSQSFFGKYFKRAVGLSPKEYREK